MKHFLPTTRKELEYLGWDYIDVILITGDAYIDHPSFGTAIIGRLLQREGLRVAILPQPNWQDDLRDFKKLGTPRYFFGITAGNMDSMINHYTAYNRLRSDDAYTAGNQAGFRPDYATVVYSKIVKELYPNIPVIIGGVEASMRRFSHYDFWSDTFRPSILVDSGADFLVYGMAEKPMQKIAQLIKSNQFSKENVQKVPQIVFFDLHRPISNEELALFSYKEELENKKNYAKNFCTFERESNKQQQRVITQNYGDKVLVQNPPYPTLSSDELDDFALFDEMMYTPHPKYLKRGEIPAWEMIKNSITIHRGCFGGCSFCAIAAHQGKYVASRSEDSILQEVKHLTEQSYFKGHITDLGGPSANMYQIKGQNEKHCVDCHRYSCIFPSICKNLKRDHKPLLRLYQQALKIKNVKSLTIGSGIRYDLLLTQDEKIDKKYALTAYFEEVVKSHVSGRLKVAPEHTVPHVLQTMRKPNFDTFLLFYNKFLQLSKKSNKNQQLIPYFISGHPNCTILDMKQLTKDVTKNRLITEQAQGFTPTPMTYATAMYYLGYDPYTGKTVYSAKKTEEKKAQNKYFRLEP
ncbi:MAG: YgiQ family radical SAM protein [Bacteroidetes bacterium]|nr:YgiQ family radical SAM protein [Bacteroidota bacterium]MCL2302673.1 YgiQ family radical SAM protein [Lentimicrobiaceae bacterium]